MAKISQIREIVENEFGYSVVTLEVEKGKIDENGQRIWTQNPGYEGF